MGDFPFTILVTFTPPTSVLLLVHDPGDLSLLEGICAYYGQEVRILRDVHDLPDHLEVRTVALMVDLARPMPSGWLRNTIQANPRLQVVVVAGQNQREAAVEALRLGAVATLLRPLHKHEVSFVVGQALTRNADLYDVSRAFLDVREVVFGNDFALVAPLARSILESALPPWDPRRPQLMLGLVEVLNNAIEHGNLGISSAEKHEALEESRFLQLLQERGSMQPWSTRKVRVRVEVDTLARTTSVTVSDQGEGFDWRRNHSPEGIFFPQRHGRGLLIARHAWDNVEFRDRGNEVILSARLPPSAGVGPESDLSLFQEENPR